MSRLTLRLPDTLHKQLENLATHEQVSLNQYIVYALTRQTTLRYTVQPLPETRLAEQQAAYTALLQNLGQASFSEIEQTLAAREKVEPDKGLTPEVVNALKKRISKAKNGRS